MRLLLRVLLVSALVWLNVRPAAAFSSGPYSHAVITQLALRRHADTASFEVNAVCAEMLVQASIVSDSAAFADKETYHCDNNNIVGCSWRLDKLKHKAIHTSNPEVAVRQAGMALHIIQDFYAHSNWVEKFGPLLIKAPLSTYKDVPPPRDVQTGRFPDVDLNIDALPACFLAPEEAWGGFIPSATHACMNKDSHSTLRGLTLMAGGFGRTYHEAAAEYAIRHSADFIRELVTHGGIFAVSCTVPKAGPIGCSPQITSACARVLR